MSRAVAVVLALLTSAVARADAPPPVAPPAGITFSELSLYAQGFSSSTPDLGGWSIGGRANIDWLMSSGERSIKANGYGFGLISEVSFGFGHYTRGSEGRQGFDLSADVLGGAFRVRVPGDVELGMFYEPIELLVLSIGGVIGSKLEVRAAWREWQLSASRAGNGFVYGFVPATGGAMYTAALEYRTPSSPRENNLAFGLRYTRIPIDDAPGAGAGSLGISVGLWLD